MNLAATSRRRVVAHFQPACPRVAPCPPWCERGFGDPDVDDFQIELSPSVASSPPKQALPEGDAIREVIHEAIDKWRHPHQIGARATTRRQDSL